MFKLSQLILFPFVTSAQIVPHLLARQECAYGEQTCGLLGCMPADATCCLYSLIGVYCPAGQLCWGDGCCPIGESCPIPDSTSIINLLPSSILGSTVEPSFTSIPVSTPIITPSSIIILSSGNESPTGSATVQTVQPSASLQTPTGVQAPTSAAVQTSNPVSKVISTSAVISTTKPATATVASANSGANSLLFGGVIYALGMLLVVGNLLL